MQPRLTFDEWTPLLGKHQGAMMTDTSNLLQEMNERSREVFRRVVEGYLESGDPVGSRTLTRDFSEKGQRCHYSKRHAGP